MPRRSSPRLAAGLAASLATCVALVGCGTTVPTANGAGRSSSTSDASGLGSSDDSTTGTADTATTGSTAGAPRITGGGETATSGPPSGGGSGTSSSTGTGSATSGGTGGPGSSTGAAARAGRGFDSGRVFVGFPTNNDASSAAQSLGLSGLDFGDQEGQVKAVVADLNRRGGLLGRTVVPVIHDLKTADLQADPSREAQATCDAFTQDRPVAAVVSIVAAIDGPTLYNCLAKRRTPIFSAGFVPVDGAYLKTYSPYVYKLPAPDFDRFGPVWLTRLSARGYFTGWDAGAGKASSLPAKVGLLHAEAQPSKRIFAALKADLARRGIAVTSDVAYDGTSISSEAAVMSNAVLTFRSNGVTHVLADASDVQLFMSTAASQGFRPRYGLNSYLAPQLQAGNTPGQLAGSIGVGWIPAVDVASADSPGPNPGETHCRQTMTKAGQSLSSYGVQLIAFSLCDGVGLLVSAATLAAGTDPYALETAFARAGPAFAPALTFRSGITSTSKSLIGAGRDFSWQGGCQCFRYLDKVDHRW